MLKYLARRTLGWLAMIFVATNLTFFLASWFLDPRAVYLERRPPFNDEQLQQMLEPKNLYPETPVFERWWNWLTGVLTRWDWGVSPEGVPVRGEIAPRMMVSLQLVLIATILAAVIGVAIGVYTASRQYKFSDRASQFVTILTSNAPVPVIALLVVLLGLRINEVVGSPTDPFLFVTGSESLGVSGFWPSLMDKLRHMLLPSLALIASGYGGYHMLQRSLLLDNINADYVRTARAKGLTRQQAIRRHGLRTSIIPVATSVAFAVPAVFTGSVLIESIFAWNGMGKYLIETINKQDVSGVVAVAAFGATLTAIGAIIADFVIVALDPRIRVS